MRNAKIIAVSMPEYVWQKHFIDFKGNRSNFIIEHFVKGRELYELDDEMIRKEIISLKEDNYRKTIYIKELENRIERFKKGEKEMTPEELEIFLWKKQARANRLSGKLADVI